MTFRGQPKHDDPTTELYIPDVLLRTDCPKHKAKLGFGCFVTIGYKDKKPKHAVCNARAKKAGFNAPIHEASLRTKFKPKTRR